MTVIQRTPDLGIGIKLQRLAPQSLAHAPYWWGWRDGSGQPSVSLENTVSYQFGSLSPYVPDIWTALVENASAVNWDIAYTPQIWIVDDTHGDNHAQSSPWTGDPILSYLTPSAVLPAPEILFKGAPITPPIVHLHGVGLNFSDIDSLPLFLAVGNTLVVKPSLSSIGGTLVARATVDGVAVGAVTLLLKRLNHVIVS